MNVPRVDGCGNMSWHGARMTEKGGTRRVATSKDLWAIDDQPLPLHDQRRIE